MTIPKFDQLSGSESLPELIELVAKLQKQVQWLMGGKLSSDNIRAQSIETESLAAKSVIAEKIDVQELSAISANLGKITAGEVYGTYIATKEAAYPRAEMSQASNQFIVYLDANNYVKTAPSVSGLPGFEFYSNGLKKGTVTVDVGANDFGFLSQVNAFITAIGSIRFNPIGGVVLVDSFSKLAAGSTSSYQTLDSAFASNMAFDPATRNLKLYAKNGSLLSTVNIP